MKPNSGKKNQNEKISKTVDKSEGSKFNKGQLAEIKENQTMEQKQHI